MIESPPLIVARGVGKSFPTAQGPLEVLKDISLDVARGEFLSLQGASGSGKSTLLSLLAGLDSPTAGEITLDGERLDRLPQSQLARVRREKVGFVFQSFHLVASLSVLENVQLPMAFRGRGFADENKARALLDGVGLTHRADFLPGKLSGGEKQRAAIARALINDPLVVFADEPTGNLDSVNGRRVLELLEKHTVQAGRSLILVTHDPDIAARAHRLVSLKDGNCSGPSPGPRISGSAAPGAPSSARGLPRGEGKSLFSFPTWGKALWAQGLFGPSQSCANVIRDPRRGG